MSLMGRLRIISSTCNTDEHGGTQVELYAAASLFDKEIYIFTPTSGQETHMDQDTTLPTSSGASVSPKR